jgi:hypothetical protein
MTQMATLDTHGPTRAGRWKDPIAHRQARKRPRLTERVWKNSINDCSATQRSGAKTAVAQGSICNGEPI